MAVNEPLLQVADLVCMAGLRPLFSGLELELPGGQWLELTGPNGTGKTTLLRAIAGLIRPETGEIRWRGAVIEPTAANWRRTLLYQGHAPALKDALTCRENLLLWLTLDHGRAFAERETDRLLERVGLARHRDIPAGNLSAGQRRRTQLARLAAATDRPLWLLDEPGNALDRDGLALLCELLDTHLAAGNGAIVATHQPITLANPALAFWMPRFAGSARSRRHASGAADARAEARAEAP